MTPQVDVEHLREIVTELAQIERPPTSEGEHQAAIQLAKRLEGLGLSPAIEEGRAYDSYARPVGLLSLAGAAAGLLALAGRRRHGALLGLLSAAAIADDVSNGPRLFRRATMSLKPTWNVIAACGDASAEGTLVVLAHHDAAPTGQVFDQTLQRKAGERFPNLIERTDTSLPLWAPVVGAPLLIALGALTGRRRISALGTALAAGSAAAFGDIARSPIVPGANDNLTAVAALVEIARLLGERTEQPHLQVLLVSCGSEESLQGGMRAFAAKHFNRLPSGRTWFLNLETIGSPRLAMVEGEGPLWMEEYAGPEFRDLIERVAQEQQIDLRRNLRSRASTDSVIASRAGYPTATIISVNSFKALSNYHLMSDTPENVDFSTVAQAVSLSVSVIDRLATT